VNILLTDLFQLLLSSVETILFGWILLATVLLPEHGYIMFGSLLSQIRLYFV